MASRMEPGRNRSIGLQVPSPPRRRQRYPAFHVTFSTFFLPRTRRRRGRPSYARLMTRSLEPWPKFRCPFRSRKIHPCALPPPWVCISCIRPLANSQMALCRDTMRQHLAVRCALPVITAAGRFLNGPTLTSLVRDLIVLRFIWLVNALVDGLMFAYGARYLVQLHPQACRVRGSLPSPWAGRLHAGLTNRRKSGFLLRHRFKGLFFVLADKFGRRGEG